MTSERKERPVVRWKSQRVDGETYVRMADILVWLRSCEETWKGCRKDDPSRVADYLANDIRDAWLEVDRPRTIGGDA